MAFSVKTEGLGAGQVAAAKAYLLEGVYLREGLPSATSRGEAPFIALLQAIELDKEAEARSATSSGDSAGQRRVEHSLTRQDWDAADLVGRIRDQLQSLYGEENLRESDEHPAFYLREGSASIGIHVAQSEAESTPAVLVASYVVKQPELTTGLYRYLVDRSGTLNMCALSIDEDGDVLLSAHIPEHLASRELLRYVVNTIRWAADELDDEIVERFGGAKAYD